MNVLAVLSQVLSFHIIKTVSKTVVNWIHIKLASYFTRWKKTTKITSRSQEKQINRPNKKTSQTKINMILQSLMTRKQQNYIFRNESFGRWHRSASLHWCWCDTGNTTLSLVTRLDPIAWTGRRKQRTTKNE